jgi:hypothetical protein
MRKRIGFLVFSILLSSPMVCSAEELGGGYSLNPPENWTVKRFPGATYKIVITQPVNNFLPNINLVEDEFSGSMDKYVASSLEILQQSYNAKKVKEASFSADNADGVKLTVDTEINGTKLRQIFYFFQNSEGQKVVVRATSGRRSASALEIEFDSILHTLRVN